jgi:polysaccharide export outer membrane protein
VKHISAKTVWLILIACLCRPIILHAVPAGQATPARAPLTQQEYHLQLSDTLEITFPFSHEYDQVATVQPDGRIALKETSEVMARGCTLPELKADITAAYRGILHEPEISITLKDFQKPSYYASGEVGKPGRYELRADTSLLQAVAEAGGILHERAKRTEVVIFRPQADGSFEAKVINLKAMLKMRTPIEDYGIHPGDVIYVPQNTFSKFSRFIPNANMGAYLAPGF